MPHLISRYPADHSKSALIPILHIAQAENDGWLSVPAMDAVAKLLKIQYIEVYEVATFYSMFNLHPVGKHVLEVCRTVPCMLRGQRRCSGAHWKNAWCQTRRHHGGRLFTLKTVECLGSCGTGTHAAVRSKIP
jgi:NADH-quinone oxidoreductase subunit E